MISRISTSSILQGFTKSKSMLAGNSAYDPAATFLIQRVTGTGSSATITFSSIPQTYKHLQLRWIARTADANTTTTLNITFNNSGANYFTNHRLTGDGTSASAGAIAGGSFIYASLGSVTGSSATASIVGAGIIDIVDYASTSKNKTLRSFAGVDRNGSGYIELDSGLWINTSAINRIDLTSNGGNWTTSTTFALYGFTG